MGSRIIPHEAALRGRLRRQGIADDEADDIVQDAYLAIARLDGVAHIRDPRAYFFTTARHALFQRLRHQRVIRIDVMTEAHGLAIADDDPGPERHVTGRMELERIRRLIEALPDRCREIFVLRRINGVPQREIARRLGVTEEIVEAQAIRGLRLILKAIAKEDEDMHGAARTKPPASRRWNDARHE